MGELLMSSLVSRLVFCRIFLCTKLVWHSDPNCAYNLTLSMEIILGHKTRGWT